MSVLTVERRDRVAIWHMSHPPVNAINGDLLQALADEVEKVRLDEAVRAVVITGNGPTFAAGADVMGFLQMGGSLADFQKAGARLFRQIEMHPKPFVAAVNGVAYGGGNELAMACDIRVAGKNARFGQPEVNLGIIPAWGGTWRLPDLVGRSVATRLLLTGDPISADEAWRIGLVDRVVDADVLLDYAINIADRLASVAPRALAELKQLLARRGPESPEAEAEAAARLMTTADAVEGVMAFQQKRRPRFQGR